MVFVSQRVLNTWIKHRQLKPHSHEAFGVLIGSCSYDRTELWIEAVTTPCPGDESSRYSFHLKDRCHQKAVDKSFKQAKGKSIYFGTWHTHPVDYPVPSNVDIKDWQQCINRNKDRQLVFIIAGIEEIRLFISVGKEFLKTSIIGLNDKQ